MSEWEAQQEEALELLYQEHKQLAIEEFTEERLRSFYLLHPDLAVATRSFLEEARVLLAGSHPTPAQVLAASAIEVTIRTVFLQPVVHGLVHNEGLAGLVTDAALRQSPVSRFRDLLFEILTEVAGADLRTLVRDGASTSLWEEIQWIQDVRNRALHRAQPCVLEEAERTLSVCAVLLDTLHPALLKGLGFHSHDGTRICVLPYCLNLDGKAGTIADIQRGHV